MTSSESEDPADRPESGGARPGDHRPGDSPVARRAELPGDVDAAFAAIVADWAAAGAPHWPGQDDGAPGTDPRSGRPRDRGHDERPDDGPSSGVGTATPPQGLDRTGRDVPPPAVPGPPGPRGADHVEPPAHRPHPPAPADEEFVPPEPPPLPRPRFGAVLGLVLLVLGVVLLAVPGLLGAPIGLGIVPGLLAMTAGLGWLVLGLRRTRDDRDGDGPDDGAVV